MKVLKQPLVSYITVLSLLLMFQFPSTLYAGNQWRLTKQESGINVYLRNTPGSAVKSFKANIKIKSSLASLVTVISDTNSFPRWLHNCLSAKDLNNPTDTESIKYVVTDMPWPVKDRDLIFLAIRTQNKTNKRVQFQLSAKPSLTQKVAGKVRIEKMYGRWLLTPMNNGEIDVLYEMSIDPGGNIPKWVVNAMAVDLPFYTLKNLKKIIQEPQYVNAKVQGIVELNQ